MLGSSSGGWWFDRFAALIAVGGGAFAYGIVFLLLFLAGWIIPLPEEPTVIAAGYVTAKQGLSLPVMLAVCVVGIQCGDLVIFWIGRRHGDWIFRSRFLRRLLPEERLAQARRLFAERGPTMAFFGRFIAGIRLVMFFTAGNLGLPLSTFVFYDLLAILITIPMGVVGGWYFADQISDAFAFVARSHRMAVGGAVAIAAAWLVASRLRRRAAARRAAAPAGGVAERPGGAEPAMSAAKEGADHA